MTKRCYVCKQEKPLAEFSKKATNPDGLQRLCRACQKAERKQYYARNKQKEFSYHRVYESEHRSEINQYRARQRAADPTYYRRAHEYVGRRKAASLEYLISLRSRYRISRALSVSGSRPCAPILSLLGCPIEDFRKHLEGTFAEGMTWEAYSRGEIQIDHIIPCCRFDLTREDHQRACFHFSNTRMLPKSLNIGRKANVYPSPEELEKYVERFAS